MGIKHLIVGLILTILIGVGACTYMRTAVPAKVIDDTPTQFETDLKLVSTIETAVRASIVQGAEEFNKELDEGEAIVKITSVEVEINSTHIYLNSSRDEAIVPYMLSYIETPRKEGTEAKTYKHIRIIIGIVSLVDKKSWTITGKHIIGDVVTEITPGE